MRDKINLKCMQKGHFHELAMGLRKKGLKQKKLPFQGSFIKFCSSSCLCFCWLNAYKRTIFVTFFKLYYTSSKGK